MRYRGLSGSIVLALLVLLGSVALPAQEVGDGSQTSLPMGFADAVEVTPEVREFSLSLSQDMYIIPKRMVSNGRYYGILSTRNRLFRSRNLEDFSRLISIPSDFDPDTFITAIDLEGDRFLVLAPETIAIVSASEQEEVDNTYGLISAVLVDDSIHAINRNDAFRDMTNLVKVLQKNKVVHSIAWPVGIKAHHRNNSTTYRIRKTGLGEYAIYSRLTGEIIPGRNNDISVAVLDDPHALARAEHNMQILQSYLETMSAEARYTNVISDVLVDDGTVYAIFLTDDTLYWKELDAEDTAAKKFSYSGGRIIGLFAHAGTLHFFITQDDRPGRIVRYSSSLGQ